MSNPYPESLLELKRLCFGRALQVILIKKHCSKGISLRWKRQHSNNYLKKKKNSGYLGVGSGLSYIASLISRDTIQFIVHIRIHLRVKEGAINNYVRTRGINWNCPDKPVTLLISQMRDWSRQLWGSFQSYDSIIHDCWDKYKICFHSKCVQDRVV